MSPSNDVNEVHRLLALLGLGETTVNSDRERTNRSTGSSLFELRVGCHVTNVLYLASGHISEALDCFEKMADWAIRYDERPDTAIYSSVIINHVAYNKEDDTEAKGISKCARLLRGNFSARIWAPIRGTDQFKNAISRMIECAQAHADDED